MLGSSFLKVFFLFNLLSKEQSAFPVPLHGSGPRFISPAVNAGRAGGSAVFERKRRVADVECFWF